MKYLMSLLVHEVNEVDHPVAGNIQCIPAQLAHMVLGQASQS
jgi:hypothetical protein